MPANEQSSISESRLFEGKASKQNIPFDIVEEIINLLCNLVAEVETDADVKVKSRSFKQMVVTYNNLRNRTDYLIPKDDKAYDVILTADRKIACVTIRNYIRRLQEYGVFKSGQEEILFKQYG